MRLLFLLLIACSALTFNFGFSVDTRGRDFSLTLRNNTGSLAFRGKPYAALAYYSQEMGSYEKYPSRLQARWIDVVAVALDGSDLLISYIDCDPQDVAQPVQALWVETLSVPLYGFSAHAGTCAGFVNANTTVAVALPRLTATPKRSIDAGIVITGPQIGLKGTRGWLVVPELGNLTTHMLSTVDCSSCVSNCLECEKGPWFELHFVTSPVAMFGIYYIFPANASFVQLNYTFALPSYAQPSLNYQAVWSGTIN
jgi:hypothetical protein